MTVEKWIVDWTLRATKYRKERLLDLGGAPQVILDGIDKMIESLEKGQIKIGGDRDALKDEWHDTERKIGRGGKTYYVINSNIRFFPEGQYGMFVKRFEEGENNGTYG